MEQSNNIQPRYVIALFAGFKALLKKLKTRIGSGGTTKDGVIELQGDQVDSTLELLAKEGYRPKRAGG